jgi:predicted RNA binding protein YcfA (HicA-like mRNA interferase family)
MGQRKYPPLTPSEVVAILTVLKFKKARQDGSHAQYECPKNDQHPRSVVTVDTGYREFDDKMMQSMIRQSNRTREVFYGATKRSARKAAVPFLKLSTSADTE